MCPDACVQSPWKKAGGSTATALRVRRAWWVFLNILTFSVQCCPLNIFEFERLSFKLKVTVRLAKRANSSPKLAGVNSHDSSPSHSPRKGLAHLHTACVSFRKPAAGKQRLHAEHLTTNTGTQHLATQDNRAQSQDQRPSSLPRCPGARSKGQAQSIFEEMLIQ